MSRLQNDQNELTATGSQPPQQLPAQTPAPATAPGPELVGIQDTIRRNCQDAFATAYWFGKRADRLDFRLKMLAFSSIAIPLLIGSVALTWGLNSKLMVPLLAFAGAFGILHTIASYYSQIAGWDLALGYARISSAENQMFYQRLRSLLERSGANAATLRRELAKIEAQAAHRNREDASQSVSESERRRGARAAMRELRLACPGCLIVPQDDKPTECPVCGKFSTWDY